MILKVFVFTAVASLVSFSHGMAIMSNTEQQEFLKKYGYLDSLDDMTNDKLSAAIKDFQYFHGLPNTGLMDEDLGSMMNRPRCGMPDLTRPNGTAAATRRWRRRNLTFRLLNSVGSIPYDTMRRVMAISVRRWTNIANIQIREANRADLQIQFSRQDGPGGTLGYAYFPENGDIYFDSLERWGLRHTSRTTDINWVATHEIGHALGLDHSREQRSIMYPYYNPNGRISRQDRARISDLYGGRRYFAESLCTNGTVDAIIKADEENSLLLLKGDKYWSLAESNDMTSGEDLISSIYQDFPGNVDAAFTSDKKSYFFKNSVYYKYENENKNFVKKLISVGFEGIPSNLDAVFFNRDLKQIYFFKGPLYYVYDSTKSPSQRVIVNGKKISDDWNGIPDDVEAVSYLNDNRVMFMKSGMLYKVNLDGKTVEEGYPKSLKTDILQCETI